MNKVVLFQLECDNKKQKFKWALVFNASARLFYQKRMDDDGCLKGIRNTYTLLTTKDGSSIINVEFMESFAKFTHYRVTQKFLNPFRVLWEDNQLC